MIDRVQRKRSLRRELLVVLRGTVSSQYQGWMSLKMLRSSINYGGGDYALDELADAMRYLVSAGHAEDESQRGVKFDAADPSFRISAKGQNLLDELEPMDKGIRDPRE